jgi:predicted RNA-binding Zn ribbon-like protein
VDQRGPKIEELGTRIASVHGCSWMFMDVHGCSWMFMDVHPPKI